MYRLTTLMMESKIFWNMTLRKLVIIYQCFGGYCCLELQGSTRRYSWATLKMHKMGVENLLQSFDPY